MDDHAVRHVIVADDVVDVDLVRRVLQLEMIVHRDELQRLGAPSQGVREQLGGTRHHLAEDALVSATGDDRQPLSDRRAKSDAVIEVVVRLDHLRHTLAGHERVDHFEDRLQRGIRGGSASTMVMWSSNSKNVLPFMNHTWSATLIGCRFASPPPGAPWGGGAERTDAGALRSSIGASTMLRST